MAHIEQDAFVAGVKDLFPDNFRGAHVLEIGSLNVNGTARVHFEHCAYTGVDVIPGPCVDVVSVAHELPMRPGSFDTVISCESLEHDVFWPQTLAKMVELLAPGGLCIITCAGPKRPEHGTPRAAPHESGTSQIQPMADHYKGLSVKDIRKHVDVDTIFDQHEFQATPDGMDLYFWGVKCA